MQNRIQQSSRSDHLRRLLSHFFAEFRISRTPLPTRDYSARIKRYKKKKYFWLQFQNELSDLSIPVYSDYHNLKNWPQETSVLDFIGFVFFEIS